MTEERYIANCKRAGVTPGFWPKHCAGGYPYTPTYLRDPRWTPLLSGGRKKSAMKGAE